MAKRNYAYKDYDTDIFEELNEKSDRYDKNNREGRKDNRPVRLAEWIRIVIAVLFAGLMVVLPKQSTGWPLWYSCMAFMSLFAIFYSWQENVEMAGRRRRN